MPTSANVRVLVGGEVVKEYTLHLQYGSTLLSSQRRQHNLYGGDYNPPREIVYDEEANAVWQAGYLQYASGAFTAFNYVDSYGWLHFENEALWNGANWHGAFRDGTYSIGLSSAPGESMGFLYTASSSGTLTVQIEDLIDSKKTTAPDTIEMAVFVNGKIAWPAGATATDSGYTGWYRIDSTTTRKGLNEALTDLRISAIAGDEIAVVFERAMDGGTSLTKADQTMIYSAVYFTTEEANYTPNHDGSRTFSGESGAWSLGYLEYASRSFSAFTATAGGNWLCAEADVANIWSGTTHGAFWRAKSYAIAPGKRTDGATGMAFTAPVNGTYALKLDSLPVNQNTMSGKLYLAVFVNGSLRPFSGDSMAQDDTSTWYLIDPATSTLEGINAKLATLSLELKAGDQLVLAFARAGDAGQTSVVPTISWTAAQ